MKSLNYSKVCDNSMSKQHNTTYPLNDELLCHASFLNFEKRTNVGFDSIEYFVTRYPHLHALTIPREMELLPPLPPFHSNT